jgi:cytidylate kinase
VITELQRLGFVATEDDDGFSVVGGEPTQSAVVDTYDDHRIAMAFTVLGLVTGGVSIANPACVAKTFPGFYDEIFRLASSAGMDTSSDPTPATTAAHNVIAIDGPSGSGKSTVAKAVADRLGLDYLDTGAMYRAVAFAALRHDIDPSDDESVAAVAREIDLDVSPEGVFVEGVDGTVEIRGPEVTRAVSAVAANAEVRLELQFRQREWATRKGGGVVEGRDIGTVVFPNARLKVFLTADNEIRAGRRAKEVTDLDYKTVAADIARRDAADSTREHNPLTKADDAVEIETSSLTIDEVVTQVVELLAEG